MIRISVKFHFIFCFTFIVIIASAQQADSLFEQKNVLKTMKRVADWQLNNWKTSDFKYPKWDWTNGACYTGIFELGNLEKKVNQNTMYLDYLAGIGNDLNWNTGPRRRFADDYCIGQTYANLFLIFKDEKMITRFKAQADSIVLESHEEALEWKNRIQQREWAWCDALFMGPTALSYLSSATNDPKYLNKAVELWWKTTAYLYDTTEHLYFRDGSYLNKKEKNNQKVFWSRGNGWVMGGLVRVLDNMPAIHPDRKRFMRLYKDIAARIITLQQPDGSWHASLLDPQSYPIKETSGTSFYAYAILWGLNNGVLDKATYWPVVQKAWATLYSSVHPDGMLGYVQPIGASPDKVDENSTEVYGVGAFLLTGSELYKYIHKLKASDALKASPEL